MKNIIWLSRHELNQDQLLELNNLYGEVTVTHVNETWQATFNSLADYMTNSSKLNDYALEYDIIAGVFPAVAIEALISVEITVISPVSEQHKVLREDGSSFIEFKHVRFATIKECK